MEDSFHIGKSRDVTRVPVNSSIGYHHNTHYQEKVHLQSFNE
jgi:hypothetical protein